MRFRLTDGAKPLGVLCEQLGDVSVRVRTLCRSREGLKHHVRFAGKTLTVVTIPFELVPLFLPCATIFRQ